MHGAQAHTTPASLDAWLSYIEAQHPQSIAMGLERVRAVASRMQLQRPARHVVTVAGTNGKGSTVAFIEAIARAAGWRVGAYTSPHLLAYNERVRIDGVDAGDAALVEAFEAVETARRTMSPHAADVASANSQAADDAGGHTIPLTYFEFGTLAALWLFARSDLDLAVLEVGLGGRLDATNLVDGDVAVVTTVDLDHQDWLGTDRETIGYEKAGIARAWRPLVLGEDDPPASVLRHAYAIGASAVRSGCDYFFEPVDAAHWRWREVGTERLLPMPRLAAPAQLRNAATAIAALRALEASIDDDAFARGISAAHVPARLQAFDVDGVALLVDVGHNPQAARALADGLRTMPVARRTVAVYAALADKDHANVVAALEGQVDDWAIAGSVEAGARGQDVAAFADRLAGTAASDAARYADVADALRAVHDTARQGDRILVFGSFHAAAEALRWVQGAGKAPTPPR